MQVNTATLPGWTGAKDITTLLASGSLTITKALVYKYGADTILELDYSDSSVSYVKFKQGRVKVGGSSNQFDTGTEVTWAA